MMQSLEVISVNLWNILISLANLVLLFIIVKKFLFKPVQNMLSKRQHELETQYSAAQTAEQEAAESKEKWESKLQGAESAAETILANATATAKARGDKIVAEAKSRADSIIRQAETEATLEYKKVKDQIKTEIVDVSSALTKHLLDREIDTADHRKLIDSFIEKIGDGDGGNQ